MVRLVMMLFPSQLANSNFQGLCLASVGDRGDLFGAPLCGQDN